MIRLYKLGEFPYGFHVDEVKVAWNSLSILKTGLDDHNGFLSLYYNSFGDYRPTGILYFTLPSIMIFGRSEFATRFMVALFSSLTVFPIYLLTETLVNKKRKILKKFKTGHLSALLLSISPWAIDLGRATNEVVISTFFALFAIYFFIRLIKSNKPIYTTPTILSLLLSYFLYHAIRYIGLPIFMILTYFYFKDLKLDRTKNLVFVCLSFLAVITVYLSTTKEGLARFSQVSIFKDVDTVYEIQRLSNEDVGKPKWTKIFDNNVVIYSKKFITEYSQYFAGDFLIGTSAKPYRFATPGVGILTYVELAFFIIGLVSIARGNKNILPLIFLLVAPFPAALTSEDAPNLSRAFLMLPFLVIIEAYGLEAILTYKSKIKNKLIIGIASLLLLNFSYFMYMYFNHSTIHMPFLKVYAGDSPTYRDIGAKDLSLKLDTLKSQYEKIIITDFPDSPYPWYAFFTNKEPSDFNKTYSSYTKERVYGNIIFSQDKCPSDYAPIKYNKMKVLIIDSWECPFASKIRDGYPLKIVGQIDRPDGTNVYTFLERDFTKPLIIDGVTY